MTVSSGGLLTETWNAIAPLLAVTTGPASCPPGCCMPRDVPGSRHGPQGNTARVLVIGSGQQIEGLDEVGPGVAGLARCSSPPVAMGSYRGRIARLEPLVLALEPAPDPARRARVGLSTQAPGRTGASAALRHGARLLFEFLIIECNSHNPALSSAHFQCQRKPPTQR